MRISITNKMNALRPLRFYTPVVYLLPFQRQSKIEIRGTHQKRFGTLREGRVRDLTDFRVETVLLCGPYRLNTETTDIGEAAPRRALSFI